MNKKILYILLSVFTTGLMVSCDDYETYADQKDRERSVVSRFIACGTDNVKDMIGQPIEVISEEQFLAQDTTTDLSKNQYVLFGTTGVYMQIVNKGCGEILKKGESAKVLSRFIEFNILADSVQLTNYGYQYHYLVDKYDVRNVSGSFYASFDTSSSLMYGQYKSASVPAGWLVPLSYIHLGRPSNENEDIARVHLIVPHDQGHAYATSGVYPCYYDITYQRGI